MNTKHIQTQAYDQCYRHKLNMPEPGTAMLKWSGILLLAGPVHHLVQLNATAYIPGIIFIVPMILVAVESHQDKVLNEIALWEERQKEEQKP